MGALYKEDIVASYAFQETRGDFTIAEALDIDLSGQGTIPFTYMLSKLV
jgi:hypothetical protein